MSEFNMIREDYEQESTCNKYLTSGVRAIKISQFIFLIQHVYVPPVPLSITISSDHN